MKTPFKLIAIAILVLGFGATASHAQTEGGFKLKHRSSFSNTTARNPFWPIGWVKSENPEVDNVQQEAAVPISADNFRVTSISLSPSPLAVINGKAYAEGEVINALSGGQKLKIVLVKVQDGLVVLQYLGKNYPVPMKQPELQHKVNTGSDDAAPKQPDNTLILR